MTPDEFIKQCSKEGISLMPGESSKIIGMLKPGKKVNRDLGNRFEKASFFELACAIGDEITPISEWIDEQQEKKHQNNHDKATVPAAIMAEGKKAASLSSDEVKITEASREVTSDDPKKEALTPEPVKKEKKSQSEFNYNSYFEKTKVSTSDSIREKKRKIAALDKEINFVNRCFTMYKRDFATLSAINKYMKYSGSSRKESGEEVSNMHQLLHVIIDSYIKQQKDDLLIKKIAEVQEAVTKENEPKIKEKEKLEKEL